MWSSTGRCSVADLPTSDDITTVTAPDIRIAPRATTSTGATAARIKPKAARKDRALKAAPKWAVSVTVNDAELDALTKRRQSPAGKKLATELRRIVPIIKKGAPVAKKPHHGRAPGRLQKNVVGYLGEDASGLYADVVTRARATGKGRDYYGRIQNQKGAHRKYLERGLKEAGG